MLRTRLIMGSILIALVVGMLYFDQWFEPYYPFLAIVSALIAVLGTYELVNLLPERSRPRLIVCIPGVVVILATNWLPALAIPRAPGTAGFAELFIGQEFVILGLAAILVEMAVFKEPGNAVVRIGLTLLVLFYLALLPSYLIQLRLDGWIRKPLVRRSSEIAASVPLALAIFIP